MHSDRLFGRRPRAWVNPPVAARRPSLQSRRQAGTSADALSRRATGRLVSGRPLYAIRTVPSSPEPAETSERATHSTRSLRHARFVASQRICVQRVGGPSAPDAQQRSGFFGGPNQRSDTVRAGVSRRSRMPRSRRLRVSCPCPLQLRSRRTGCRWPRRYKASRTLPH